MNIVNLRVILDKHKKWLLDEEGGERADLREADLREADLCGADLCEADLRGADLREADLYGADLRGADLRGADLCGADLRGANVPDYVCPLNCPEEGSFIGFKKARNNNDDVIVKLRITETAKRSSATSRKCRCSEAEVLSIESLDGKSQFEKAISKYNATFVYEVGKIVRVEDFYENRWEECSTGIHFFITREEPEIDWGKVAVDTPILVRDCYNEVWLKRYFAKYENGKVYAWADGATSWSSDDITCGWNYAKLAGGGEE